MTANIDERKSEVDIAEHVARGVRISGPRATSDDRPRGKRRIRQL